MRWFGGSGLSLPRPQTASPRGDTVGVMKGFIVGDTLIDGRDSVVVVPRNETGVSGFGGKFITPPVC